MKPGAPLLLIYFPEAIKRTTPCRAFLISDDKILLLSLYLQLYFDYSSINGRKIIYILRVVSTFALFERFSGQPPSLSESAGW